MLLFFPFYPFVFLYYTINVYYLPIVLLLFFPVSPFLIPPPPPLSLSFSLQALL